MIYNFLKIAIRNIFKNKTISLINIIGLAIGITCCILLLLWVNDELSFENFHENADNIYCINKKYQMGTEVSYNPSTPFPLANASKTNFAQTKDATKLYRRQILLKYEDNVFTERRVAYTDSSFFNIFSFQFIKGTKDNIFSNPNSIVITEAIQQKYFASTDPIGKILTIDNRRDYTVAGIIKNIPTNSDLRFDMFVSISQEENQRNENDWGSHWLRTFILLNENTNKEEVEADLSALIKERLPEEKIALVLQPLKDIHLYAANGEPQSMRYVYFFSVIAFFIMAIACINYINLSTARSVKRFRESGIYKVMGANRFHISGQFLIESILYIFISLIVAAILTEFARPIFNEITGKNLIVDFSDFKVIIYLIVFALITGIVSGLYPAIMLSASQPASVLKGLNSQKGKGKKNFRKILVVFQFALSIFLIIGTFIVYSQLQYIQNKEMGYNKENIMYLSLNSDIRENYDALKTELLQNPEILTVTKTSELPTEINSIIRGITWKGKETEEGSAFGFASVDYDYFETMDMEMVQGRGFSKKFAADSANYIFNEKAIATMGMEYPIGKRFAIDGDDPGTIIGVIKDFHSLPLTYEIEPMVFLLVPDYQRYLLVKIQSDNVSQSVKKIDAAWAKFAPSYPFEYHFLDEEFEILYIDEITMGKIFSYFVILAIFISSLGLLGLSSFTAEQRTKEIGLRKVLGATESNIIFVLTKEFTKWVLYANIIAWPLAWFAMNSWLQNFAYRTEMHWWVFLLSGGIALLIAVLTISSQAIKAALANPVESLRYE